MLELPTHDGTTIRGWRPRNKHERCADCFAAPGEPCCVAYGKGRPDRALVLDWGHMQRETRSGQGSK